MNLAILTWAVAFLFLGAVLWSLARTRKSREQEVGESLPMQDRSLLSPLKRLTRELEEVIAKNKESTGVQVLGSEALNDARTMLQRAETMLGTRRELKRTLMSKYNAQHALEDLEARLADSTDSAERETLEKAKAARLIELSHYTKAEEGIDRIEAGLKQAEAALSEIKTRLSLMASENRAGATEAVDDLRDALTRVRAIGNSFEETQSLLNG